jgi:tetratricopeptide (TPR) repeat protein
MSTSEPTSAPTLPTECRTFLEGPGYRLEGLLGSYAFRSVDEIEALAIDATRGAIVTVGTQLSIWDANTGACRTSYPIAGTALAVHPHDGRAVVGAADGHVALLELATGHVTARFGVGEGDEGAYERGIVPKVTDVAFAGSHVVARVETSTAFSIFVDGRRVLRVVADGEPVPSADGALVACGYQVFDATNGSVVLDVPDDRPPSAYSASFQHAFSLDGMRYARTTPSGGVELWDVRQLRAGRGIAARIFAGRMPVPSWDREGKSEVALHVLAPPDGSVVTSTYTELQIWRGGAIEKKIPFHADHLALSPEGRRVWGVRKKKSIVAVDLATSEAVGQPGHLAEVNVVTHSPRAPLALTGGGDGRVLLWHLPTGSLLRELPDAYGAIVGAAFFPDGRRIAAIDGTRMFVWDAATKELVAKLDRVSPRETGLRENLDLDTSPDGRHALVCTYSDHVLLWNAESNETVYCREVPGVRSASFGPSPSVVVLGASQELLVFDLAKGETVRAIPIEPDGVRHHPHLVYGEGKRAMRICTGRGLFVYDLETTTRALVPVTDDAYKLLSMSPDGRYAVIATSDDPKAYRPEVRREIAIVDAFDGSRTVISFASAGDAPECASFASDGTSLLVGTARGVILRFAMDLSRVARGAPTMRSRSGESSPSLDRVIVAPVRAPASEDEPLSTISPLGTTTPRAGVGPSSASPGSIEAAREEAIAILRRVGALYARGAYNEALAMAAPLRRHLFASFPPGDLLIASAVANLAELHTKVGELREAEALHREALERVPQTAGDRSESHATVLSNAGNFSLAAGDHAHAEALHRRALDIRRTLYGDRHPMTAESTSSLGFVLAQLGRPDLAEPLYRTALEAFRATVGPSHAEHAKTLHNLGILVGQAGRFAESETALQESLRTRRAVLAPMHPEIAQGLASLGTLYIVSHRAALAEPVYREALEISRTALGEDAVETSTRAVDLAVSLRALGRNPEAVPLLRRALEVRMAKLPPTDPRISNVRRMLTELGG